MSGTTSIGGGTAGRAGSAPHLPVHDSTPEDTPVQVSTGELPDYERVRELVVAAHRGYRRVADGDVADYIPALAQVSPDLFGIAVAGVGGRVVGVGDSAHSVTIQSVAKPFVFALACEVLGHRDVLERLGVNATGLPFDSVMAVELPGEGLTNPMVNSGAIATTSLVPGRTAELKWTFLREDSPGSPVVTSSWTRRCSPRSARRAAATRPSRGCSSDMAASTSTRTRPPTSTRAKGACW